MAVNRISHMSPSQPPKVTKKATTTPQMMPSAILLENTFIAFHFP